MSANKIIANPAIAQRGTYGYLLWLRRDLPQAYRQAALQIPAVANFEASLRSTGLGDDDIDLSDLLDVADSSSVADVTSSPFDTSDALDLSAYADDTVLDSSIASAVNQPVSIDQSTILDSAGTPTLPPIAPAPPDIVPSAPSTAAQAVNVGQVASVVAASTAGAPKASNAAAAQVVQAVAGVAPLLTGVVSTANGAYLAPIAAQPGSLSSVLSSSVAGIPIWIIGLGAVGLLALLSAKD
jgi:hypothetical protein